MAGAPPIPVEALVPLLQFPYGLAAAKTGFPGWALSADEAAGVAPLVDAVLKQYMPQTASPHGAAIALVITLSAFTGMKLMAYVEWKRDQVNEKPGKAPEPDRFPIASGSAPQLSGRA